MKSRAGFVSNSSTSSFIVIIRKSAYNKAYAEADPYTRAVLDQLMREETIFGISVMTASEGIDHGGDGTWSDFSCDYDPPNSDGDKPDHCYEPYCAFHDFVDSLDSADIWTTSIDL